MKILLLYTPRSGSTSILKYFQKVKPEYECYNEPWFEFMQSNVYNKKITYLDLCNEDNIFVKSAYATLPVELETTLNDFDKIIILLRKNKKEQVESCILAHNELSFLNYKPRKYSTFTITDNELKKISERYDFLNESLLNFSKVNKLPVFYYEDLYYDSFTPLFEELGIEYNEECYSEFLDVTNKYRVGDLEEKQTNTLI
jgi:hypothetical protein